MLAKDIVIKGVVGYQREKMFINGAINVFDLMDAYEIDEWKPDVPIEKQGCQRTPIQSHYRKIGKKAKEKNSFFPTSIILSLRKEDMKGITMKNDEKNSDLMILTIPKEQNKKLKIIDGQHRAKGFESVIKDLLKENIFQVPFVLVFPKDRVEEITWFYEINSKAKKVVTDLALQLLNEMNKGQGINLSKGEHWKVVASNVAKSLNSNPKSVWHNCLSVGDNKKGDKIASSSQFAQSLKPLLDIPFVKNLWIDEKDLEVAGQRVAKLVNNYWNALKVTLPKVFPSNLKAKHNYVIQKTGGIYAWHIVSPTILETIMYNGPRQIRTFDTETIKEIIKNYGDTGVINDELFWKSGNGEASRFGGQKGFVELGKIIKEDFKANFEQDQNQEVVF